MKDIAIPMHGSIENTVNIGGWSKHTPIHTEPLNGGVHMIFRFENSYGASLINHNGSYGNELAVIKFFEPGDSSFIGPDWDNWDFVDIGLGDHAGIMGWLTPQQIEDTLDIIKALKVKEITA